MSWFKLDDKFHGHKKTLALFDGPCPADALALWALAASWCADQLSDGAVPISFIRRSGLDRRSADELVRVRLWERDGEGYRFRKWLQYQKSRDQVLKDRADATARKRRRGGSGSGEPDESSGDPSREPARSSPDGRANLAKVQPTVARRNGDPSPELSAPIRSGSDPDLEGEVALDLRSGSSRAGEASAAATAADVEAEGRAVSATWHASMRAATCTGLHGFDQWRRDFELCGKAVRLAAEGDAVGIAEARAALCGWWWLAIAGPIKGGRVLSGKATPQMLAKGVTADLAAARRWWDGLNSDQRRCLLERGCLPIGQEAAE